MEYNRTWLIGKKEKQKLIQDSLNSLILSKEEKGKWLKDADEARVIMNNVLMATQKKVKSYVEEIVTLILSSVYGDSYSFELDIQIKRNQSEVYPIVLEHGEPFSPKNDEVGGGVVDVVSLGLRFALWSLQKPKTAKTFILDEPGKFTGALIGKFALALKQISELLGIQIIVISHDRGLIDIADKSYVVEKRKGISYVTEG